MVVWESMMQRDEEWGDMGERKEKGKGEGKKEEEEDGVALGSIFGDRG